MKQAVTIIGIVVLFIASVAGVYMYQQQRINTIEAENNRLTEELATARTIDSASSQEEQANPASYSSEKGVGIVVKAPAQGSAVESPLEVTGSVPGSWSNEGRFTVRLMSDDGTEVARQPATLGGDWMTNDLVSFSTVLIFTAPDANTGSLVLEKANPSGLAENDDSLTIPVRF